MLDPVQRGEGQRIADEGSIRCHVTFPQHDHGVSMLVWPILWRVLDFIFGLEHVPKKLIDFFDQNMHYCLSDARGILLVFHLTSGEAADSRQRDN